MTKNNNSGLLAVIAVVLIAIAGLMVYEMNQPDTPSEKVAESISDAADSIGDAAEDAAN